MNKRYTEQRQKLETADIKYRATFLNGVARKENSINHAIYTVEIFNQLQKAIETFDEKTLR